MLAAYGVDVLDPAVSTRRVHVLLDRLPPQARRGGEMWSTEAELLAQLVDHVAELTWVTLRAHGAKNVAKPRPMARPRRGVAAAHRPAGSRPGPAQDQPGKHDSWMAAARALAGMPGVVVSDGR
jgi:hypothetical protein